VAKISRFLAISKYLSPGFVNATILKIDRIRRLRKINFLDFIICFSKRNNTIYY
jgi:hypothetical protein